VQAREQLGEDRGEPLESELRRIVAPILEEQGVELVELYLCGSGNRRVLRLDIDRAGARGIDVTDCQRVSQRLGAALDEADVLESSYMLEVSSPGVDRPIRTSDDFRRNSGRRVAVTCVKPDGAEHSVRGLLIGQDGDAVQLRTDDGNELRIRLADVRHARQEVGF